MGAGVLSSTLSLVNSFPVLTLSRAAVLYGLRSWNGRGVAERDARTGCPPARCCCGLMMFGCRGETAALRARLASTNEEVGRGMLCGGHLVLPPRRRSVGACRPADYGAACMDPARGTRKNGGEALVRRAPDRWPRSVQLCEPRASASDWWSTAARWHWPLPLVVSWLANFSDATFVIGHNVGHIGARMRGFAGWGVGRGRTLSYSRSTL